MGNFSEEMLGHCLTTTKNPESFSVPGFALFVFNILSEQNDRKDYTQHIWDKNVIRSYRKGID